ncbi:unnamed protein product [Saccharomyces cerevisiae]|nr:unnamed protein product [Saccharomyces cerevisiae]
MPNGQASYAFQGAYQGQPGAGSMEQSQYAQPQYNQYPQQQLQQGVVPQQQQLQQGVVPQQSPIYGEQSGISELCFSAKHRVCLAKSAIWYPIK